MKTTYSNNSGQNKKNNNSRQEGRSCYFCKKAGHINPDCRKYKTWKSKNCNQANAVKEDSTTTGETLFMTVESVFTKQQENFEYARFSVKAKKNYSNTWFVDAGATSHMTISKDFFIDFDSNIKGFVRLADPDKVSKIEGKGSGAIKFIVDGKQTQLKIKDVLYVPSFESNLVSVRKLTKEGYKVNFDRNIWTVTKYGEKQAMAKFGADVEDLYEVQKADERSYAEIKIQHDENGQHAWHMRFGHRNISAIKDLAQKQLAIGIQITDCGAREICVCCKKGKMARKPFPNKSHHKTQAILDLIHTDICGPMEILTPGRKRYLMTLIDDYSRYTTVYLLTSKDEAGPQIKRFIQMMKTQFGKIPKCIRSDRGKEYINKALHDF